MKTEKYFIACNKQDGTVTFEKAVKNFDEFTTNLIIASGLITLMKWLKEKRGD